MKKNKTSESKIDVDVKNSGLSNKITTKSKKKTVSTKKQIVELQEQLKSLSEENAELNDKYIRLAAEFDNHKKRTTRDFELRIQNAKESILLEVLSIMDDLNRTLQVIGGKKKNDPIAKGVQLIHSQTKKFLDKYSVEEINSKGEEFDVELHEAMMIVDTDDYPANVVVEEHQKGYKINGRVLRHAKVAVNKS